MKLLFFVSLLTTSLPIFWGDTPLDFTWEVNLTNSSIAIDWQELTEEIPFIISDFLVDSWHLIDSWATSTQIENPLLPENIPPLTTWGLYIDEIFARDTAFLGEYIIIGSSIDYSWAVEVVGLWQGTASKIFPLSIQVWQKVLITDTISKIWSWTGSIILQSSITLTDNWEELLIKQWTVTDDHIVYQASTPDQALFYTEVDSSWRRVFSTSSIPSLLLQSSWSSSTTWEVEVNIDPSSSWSSLSWDTLTWVVTQSGDIILPPPPLVENSCPLSLTTGSITITEIHPFDTDQFPEYIELLVDGFFTTPISIVWLGQGQVAKVVLLSGLQNLVIITDDISYFPPSTHTIHLSSISLTDSWEPLQILWQSWQVLDSTVYTDGIQGKSLYYSWDSTDWIFKTNDLPSPWFDLSQVNHLLFDKNLTSFYSCSIDLQHTEPFFAGRKINIIASANNKQIQNSSDDYSCERSFNTTNYLFTWCNPSFFEFDTGGIYSVWLTIQDHLKNQTCSTTLSLNYPLDPTEGLSCKQDYYQELYLKRKDRFDYLKKWLGSFWLAATASGDIYQKWTSTGATLSMLTGKVDIVSILPNPAWKDDNQENITLKNNDTLPYDLTTFLLFNGKSKKKFPVDLPTLQPWQQYKITATLWLTNRPTCVKLQDKITMYDTFCYPQAWDDQLFTVSLDSLQTVANQDPKLLSQITVALDKTQACAFFDKQQVVCKALRFADSLVTEYKKQAKKSVSLEKKLTKEQTKSLSYKQKYDDQRNSRAEDKKSFSLKLKAQKAAESLARNQTRLVQWYAQLLVEELETNRYEVYKGSTIPWLRKLYTTLNNELKAQKEIHTRWWVPIPTQDIDIAYSLTQHGSLPLQQIETETIYQDLFIKTQQTVDDLLNNLTINQTHLQPP